MISRKLDILFTVIGIAFYLFSIWLASWFHSMTQNDFHGP